MSLRPENFTRLVESRAQFVSFVTKHVGSPAVAEDIVQTAFLRTLEKGDTILDGESSLAWFYRVLRNAIIDHYRRQASATRAGEKWAAELEQQAPFDDPTRAEMCQCVSSLLDNLKPEYRDAIRFVVIEERSLYELAQTAGIKENNAAVRVHRARRALRSQVVAACGACAQHGCLQCSCRSRLPTVG